MSRLFGAADRSGQGVLSFVVFKALLSDPFVNSWLAAYELQVVDAEMLCKLVDDGDGALTEEELLYGFARLRGNAKSNLRASYNV